MIGAAVLIAGCGELGGRIAQRLVPLGVRVHGLRRQPGTTQLPIEWISADLTARLPPLPTVDQIIYAAAPDQREPEDYRAIYVDGLLHLARAASSLTRIWFVSSTAVYGADDGRWVDENDEPQPRRWNGEILLEAERSLRALRPDSIVLRLAGLYGSTSAASAPEARSTRDPNPRWINRIHRDQAADAIVHLLGLRAPEPLYNIAGEPELQGGTDAARAAGKRIATRRLRASGFAPREPAEAAPETHGLEQRTPPPLELIERFRSLLEQARASSDPEPTAMTLATAHGGRVSARTVLLKDVDARGFVFYSNVDSLKGAQLAASPQCALLFLWKQLALQVQVRIEGEAEPVTDAEADAYFATRPRGSQIGAWASLQSQTLDTRQTLLDRVAQFEAINDGKPVPRPSNWSGWRVLPERIEFWFGREFRLHERESWELVDGQWQSRLLYP